MAWRPDYATDDELRAYMTDSDVEIPNDEANFAGALTAASRAIDRHTRRQFGKVASAEARYYTARWSRTIGAWFVAIDDLQSTTGLAVRLDTAGDGTYATTLSSGDYVLRPRNAAAKGDVWTELMVRTSAASQPNGTDGEFEIAAPWGWTAIPVPVKQACLLQSSRIVVRRDSPYGVAGSPQDGSEMRLLARVDPDVSVMLDLYRKRARPQ